MLGVKFWDAKSHRINWGENISPSSHALLIIELSSLFDSSSTILVIMFLRIHAALLATLIFTLQTNAAIGPVADLSIVNGDVSPDGFTRP